jgi:hypothetical protein
MVEENGQKLRDFCTFNRLRIANTFSKHKNIHKYTWQARGTKSVLDCHCEWNGTAVYSEYQSLQRGGIWYRPLLGDGRSTNPQEISQKPKEHTIGKERNKIQ